MPPTRNEYRLSVIVYFVFLLLFYSENCYARTTSTPSPLEAVDTTHSEPHVEDSSLKIFHFTSNYIPNTSPRKDGKSETASLPSTDELIPDFCKIVLVIKPKKEIPKATIIRTVCEALSRILDMSVDNIKVSKYEMSTGILKMYFVYPINNNGNSIVLLPAADILPKLSVDALQKEIGVIKVISIETGDRFHCSEIPTNGVSVWNVFSDRNWRAWQLAVIIACCLFALFCVFVVILFLSARRSAKDNNSCPVEERQVVVQPVLKPNVTGVNVIQPENKDCFITETDSEHTPSPCRSPLRMKGKGLLERRGSNASLTLDLNRSQENIHYSTPPKECSTEEYLLSASNRLTRKQLRNCLKDVKALHTEFWEIPMNHPEKVEVAGSGTKNRYKTILPNESTRVQLNNTDDDPLTAYINANYVRGYANERNAYIATQGPMAHTVNDFWSMVWEQKCPIIVMITKLKEKLKVKCEPYIPDYQNSYLGIKVTVLKVLPRDGYTIRELYLTNGRESRCVYHFWYTAWPDHKTPDTAKQLLAMALEVEGLRHNGNGTIKGPTVVHCSAGIGRTGCFVAVSIGIQQLLEENMVDVLGTVCGLRLDRGGMVQTAEQYEFVHQALGVFEATMPDQSGE